MESIKVIDQFKKAKKTLFSFEIIPPLKGTSIHSIFEGIDPLMEFKPAYINVTYHREEYIFKKHSNGLLEKISTRKRPGTVGICAAIINKYGVSPVPHLICGGFSKEETENALVDLNFLGINNVLVLRGDPIKTESVFIPEQGGHAYAIDLMKQVVDMNNGKYLHDEYKNVSPTDFCIGVSGYPEKHFEAPNLEFDLMHLKKKVDAGAEYVVTQMFFDNSKYFEFVKRCREMDINVPIVPGVKPITTINHLHSLPRYFHLTIPNELASEVEKCKDNKAAKEVGIEWGIQQCRELIEFGAPAIHFYTMSRSQAVRDIAKALW